ncbi:MAG: hypothetical protein H6R10_1805 [Rhodocyclaceae bacterium]|nr:hypothetical protein [Rhodocyclaceae bacterium]
MKPSNAVLSGLMIGLMSGNAAWAADGFADDRGQIVLAGEILVGPDKADVRAPGARSQRQRASAYQAGAENAPPEEEGGFLSPPSGAPAEERAFGNRSRARAYQQGADPSAVVPGLPSGLGDLPLPATSQDRARDLRTRARVYTGSGNAKEVDLSHVGADGIPIVPCRADVDNVAARIGEDAVSGSVFQIMRNGQPVKVRCK